MRVFVCPLVCARLFITFFFVCVRMCLFALGLGLSFFGGIQHFPVDGCSAASCNFGVLTGEDEHMSFYSAILEVQGQRRSPSKMVGGVKSHLESNPIPARDAQRAQTNLVCNRTQRSHRD